MSRLTAVLLAALLGAMAPAAMAGQSCEQRPVTAAQLSHALSLAERVHARLAAHDTDIAILARVGSDVSAYGLRWTHAGLVYRVDGAQGWRVLHKLNYCGRDSADLYRQGLANFFLDDPEEWRAWLLIPGADLQRQIAAALRTGAAQALNEPRYSMIAYPFALRFQNSNQWLLELLAVAADPSQAADRSSAQRWLRRTGYEPGSVAITPFKRFGASVARPNISFNDHPLADRLQGSYKLVTVESLEQYLRGQGALAASEEIRLPGPAPHAHSAAGGFRQR